MLYRTLDKSTALMKYLLMSILKLLWNRREINHFLSLISCRVWLWTWMSLLLSNRDAFLAYSNWIVTLQLRKRYDFLLHQALWLRIIWGCCTTYRVILNFRKKILFLSLQNYLLISASWSCWSRGMQRIQANWSWLTYHDAWGSNSSILFVLISRCLHIWGRALDLFHDFN